MADRKLSICHIIAADVWAGAEVQAYTLVKGLHGVSNINIQVITFNEGILSSFLSNEGVQVNILPESSNSLLLLWRIYSILKKERIDVVHVHGYKENFFGGIISRILSLKIIRTHHGRGMINGSTFHRLIEKINERYLTDVIISVSNELKYYLVKHAFAEEKIFVIRNGIQRSSVKPSVNKQEIKKLLNIEDDICVIGTIGRMVPAKGHKYLLEGVLEVIKKNKNVMFVLVGSGPLMEESKYYAEQLGISNYVRFVGFRKDAIDILNIFDIFILTSIHEGIPIVLLEAMCLGKPIITTSVGGIPEIIKENYNGLLISAEKPEEISKCCNYLIENRELRKQLSYNAIKDVVENHSLDMVLMETENIYRASI